MQPKTCVMARVVESISKEDLATLVEWVGAGVPTRLLVTALRAEYPNSPVGDKSVTLHLRGQCCCTNTSDAVYGVR